MKKGTELIFIAPQNRRHGGHLVTERIVTLAKELGIERWTERADSEGTGKSGHLHSSHFFELANQPVELVFMLEEEKANRLVDAIQGEGIPVFCVRKPVEFGELGE